MAKVNLSELNLNDEIEQEIKSSKGSHSSHSKDEFEEERRVPRSRKAPRLSSIQLADPNETQRNEANAKATKEFAEKKEPESQTAPLNLMAEFMTSVVDHKNTLALEICRKILDYEPNNIMMQEYETVLQQIIEDEAKEEESTSGTDEPSVESESDSEDSDRAQAKS